MQHTATHDELAELLAKLTPEKALKLAAYAEEQRIAGERAFPTDLILDSLRPTLTQQQAQRTPTALRLFCEPIEDFLVDRRDFKQPGRIARRSIRTLWRWLSDDALRLDLPDLEAQLSSAILSGNVWLQEGLHERLQVEVLRAIEAATQSAESEAARYALARKLGGDDVVHDMQEIGFLIARAQPLSRFKAQLPQRIDTLSDQHLATIRETCAALTGPQAGLKPYAALLVLARLDQPWEAVRLAEGTTDFDAAAEILLADIEGLALDIAGVQPNTFDPAALLPKLDRFVRTCVGLIRELRGKGTANWRQRLLRTHQLAACALNELVEIVPAHIAAALPLTRPGTFSVRRQREPDLSEPPDAFKVRRALELTKFLASSAPYARGGGFHLAHRQAFDAASDHVRAFAESAGRELHAPNRDKHERLEAYLTHAGDILEALLATPDIEQFRYRIAV
ncbi:MAG: hypothetical protein KBA31_09110 [Alphaproteobacteria bacterium]|nr:hypothetical protein [Alphaproteobacteria bacterium]